MDDGDSLRLRLVRFFDEPVQIVRVAGEQHDRAFELECRRSHDGIDSAPMTGKPGRSEQVSGMACDTGRYWHDRDSGEHTVHASITRTSPEHFGQRDRANGNPGTPGPSAVQVGMCPRIARRQLGKPFAVEDQRSADAYSPSGHAARASATYSSGTGPCSAVSRSESSASKSSSS